MRAGEHGYRVLAENSAVGIWQIDPAGRTLYINPAMLRMLELEKAEELAGKTYHPFFTPESLIAIDREHTKRKTGQTSNYAVQVIGRHGRRLELLVCGAPLFNPDKSFHSLIGTFIDHDARAHANFEAQLRQSEKMEAIGRLASGIAHDFNNILTAISGNARLSRQDVPATHPIQESLAEIEKAVARAADLVKQILTFSRQLEAERQPLDLKPVVEEAVKFLRTTLPASIDIETHLDSELPSVSANAAQIHQVVMNLGANAAQAMKNKGRLELRLISVAVDHELARRTTDLRVGKYVCLSVIDQGCGLGASMLKNIFDPFFTTKSPGKGLGLGLSIVHGIVKSHEGAITVESELNKGTTFHLYFPAVSPPEKEVKRQQIEQFPGHGERILFVDDEEAIVFITTRMLRRLGYEVVSFTNSLEALTAFTAKPRAFDLVITDMSMPNLDGPRLVGELQKLRPDLPIVMITGYIRPQDIESALNLGISELILKPNTVNDLAESLHNLLRKRRD